VLHIRNLLFNWGVLSSTAFNFPVISVGNLSVGGTGKTPHTEFLIELLRNDYHIASLSRGYGRKTKGFKIADSSDSPESIGDEPYQIFTKYDRVIVAVDEKRKRGIEKLRALPAKPEVVILDDAFQHRSVKAGLNILLTDYSKLYINDLPLPSGRLREPRSAAKRADIIIVTKSPEVLSNDEREKIIKLLNPKPHQKVYFSYIAYKNLQPLNHSAIEVVDPIALLQKSTTILLSAIANPKPMVTELKRNAKKIIPLTFKDHHFFQVKDYVKINKRIAREDSAKKVIVCSEKDAVKIDSKAFGDVPLFALPIVIKFHKHNTSTFKNHIKTYVKSHTA